MLPLLLFWRVFPLFHYSILSGEKQAEHIIFYVSVYFRRTIGNAGGDRYSLFIIRYSLFTENNGSSNAAEAAPRRELRKLGELRLPSPKEIAGAGSVRRFVADERNAGAAFRQQCAFRREIRDFVAVYGISSRNTAFRRIILPFPQYYAIIDSYASPCVNIIL